MGAPDGREIYFVSPDGDMMAVPVTLSPQLKVGSPKRLFAWQKPPAIHSALPYDVSPVDGRFLVTLPVVTPVSRLSELQTEATVILHWRSELASLKP
jgi:hypothetical protein